MLCLDDLSHLILYRKRPGRSVRSLSEKLSGCKISSFVIENQEFLEILAILLYKMTPFASRQFLAMSAFKGDEFPTLTCKQTSLGLFCSPARQISMQCVVQSAGRNLIQSGVEQDQKERAGRDKRTGL